MAEVILPVNLAVMIAKTFFVVDAIRGIRGHKSVVCRAARAANSSGLLGSQRSSSSQGRRSAPNRPPVLAQRGRSASASAGSPKVRSLHVALVLEHIVALIAIASTVLKYALPVTASNCNATHKVSTAFAILFDASLLTFLLFKVDVTNGIRKLSCWEKGVIWICRAFAWIYLPLASIFVSVTYPGGTNEEGTFCENGFNRDEDVNYEREASDNAYGYAVTNAMLLVQYVLLLILFVRPLMVRLEGAQSGGAVYRRVVIRNISCTVAVVVSYIITTIVTVIALLRQHPNDTASAQVVDVSLMTNMVVILCLTEIALPLGFTSCWKACSLELCSWSSSWKEGPSDLETAVTADGTTTASGTMMNNHNNHNNRIVPVEVSSVVPVSSQVT